MPIFIGRGKHVNIFMRHVVLGRRHEVLNSYKFQKGLAFFPFGEQFFEVI